MGVIKKALKLEKIEFYETHLALVNAILPVKLTPREIEVLARFMSFEGEMADDRFGTSARKRVKKELELTDGGLGNFISSLKKKKFLVSSDDKVSIWPLIIPAKGEQDYMFKLTNIEA